MGRSGQITIWDLKRGQEILCYVRPGYAPRPEYTKNGVVLAAPKRGRVARATDQTKFWGYVLDNDPVRGIITLRTMSARNRYQEPTGEPISGSFSYSIFTRVRLMSTYSTGSVPDSPFLQTIRTGFPHRTIVDVKLHK